MLSILLACQLKIIWIVIELIGAFFLIVTSEEPEGLGAL